MSEQTTQKHEAFGIAGFSRVSGHSGPLFGSSVNHHHVIRLRVARGEVTRDLHHNWFRRTSLTHIVEVDFSPTQFADLLTAMNVGDGVPCTLRYVNGKRMTDPPQTDQRAVFEAEFDGDVAKVMKDANDLAEKVDGLLQQGSVRKSDLKEVSGMLRMLMQHINSNLPFVQQSFNEAMEKTVTEAKGEVEAFVQTKVLSLGIEALNEQVRAGMVSLPAMNHPQLENK